MRQSGKHVETDRFYNRVGNPKPVAIFEVFGEYCGKTGAEVRGMMVDYVNHNIRSVEADFRNALVAKNKKLSWWILK